MATPITMSTSGLNVPNDPIIPFIEGDGIGPDIWAASVRVFDAAVNKAYGGQRKVEWQEVLAGEKAFNQTGSWLPDATLDAFRQYLVGIKGPLTTPVGGGIRSLLHIDYERDISGRKICRQRGNAQHSARAHAPSRAACAV